MRDNGSIKQTEVKNIAIAQQVMEYEKKTTMNTNIFVGQFSRFIGLRKTLELGDKCEPDGIP